MLGNTFFQFHRNRDVTLFSFFKEGDIKNAKWSLVLTSSPYSDAIKWITVSLLLIGMSEELHVTDLFRSLYLFLEKKLGMSMVYDKDYFDDQMIDWDNCDLNYSKITQNSDNT